MTRPAAERWRITQPAANSTTKRTRASGSGPTRSSCPRRSNQRGKSPIERSSTSMRAAPRHPISPASVTTSEGRPSLATHQPLISPATAAAARRGDDRQRQRRVALVQRGQHARRPGHHRGDREVDLAGDDDERHRDDDDDLLDVQLEEVDEVVDAEVAARLRQVEHDRSRAGSRRARAPTCTGAPSSPTATSAVPRRARGAGGRRPRRASPPPGSASRGWRRARTR